VSSPVEVSDKGVNLLGVKGDTSDSSILFNIVQVVFFSSVQVVFFSSVLTLK